MQDINLIPPDFWAVLRDKCFLQVHLQRNLFVNVCRIKLIVWCQQHRGKGGKAAFYYHLQPINKLCKNISCHPFQQSDWLFCMQETNNDFSWNF